MVIVFPGGIIRRMSGAIDDHWPVGAVTPGLVFSLALLLASV